MKFSKNQYGFSQIIILLIIIAAIVIGVYLVQTRTNLLPKAAQTPKKTPETSFILESNDSPILNREFKVNLLIRSDIDATNLYSAKLKFPTDYLEVTTIKTAKRDGIDGFISLWADRKWDNKLGTISLVGGVPNPGFKTGINSKPALMAVIYFKAKKSGTATIIFDETSAIYRNSDNQNILNTKNSLELNIKTSETSPQPSASAPLPSVIPTSIPAVLSLVPDFKRGCSYSININVDTADSKTYGTDAVIKYDPVVFSINNIQNSTFYQSFPGNSIQPSIGKISVSGLAVPNQPVSGKGTLATLQVTVNPSATLGETHMDFDFDPLNPSKTSDSNVVILDNGIAKEILGKVISGTYNISDGACR